MTPHNLERVIQNSHTVHHIHRSAQRHITLEELHRTDTAHRRHIRLQLHSRTHNTRTGMAARGSAG